MGIPLQIWAQWPSVVSILWRKNVSPINFMYGLQVPFWLPLLYNTERCLSWIQRLRHVLGSRIQAYILQLAILTPKEPLSSPRDSDAVEFEGENSLNLSAARKRSMSILSTSTVLKVSRNRSPQHRHNWVPQGLWVPSHLAMALQCFFIGFWHNLIISSTTILNKSL